ncbi:MAG: hypothetical protein AAGA55_06990 [Planctomycetota bacterium]
MIGCVTLLFAMAVSGPVLGEAGGSPDAPIATIGHATTGCEQMRTGRARLSLMRADGRELAWIEGDLSLPAYTSDRVLPESIAFEPARFDTPPIDPSSLPVDALPPDQWRSFRLVIDRDTSLADGGISGARGALTNDGMLRLASIASGEGEYDFYDLRFAWDALAPGPLTVSLTGGLKAIDARIGKVVDEGGLPTFEDARGVIAVPIIGGGVSWRLDENIAFTGSAVTQSFSGGGSVLDMSAETSIMLSPNIGIRAGYQFIRSAIEVQSLGTQLEREGVYARISIEF